MGTRPASLVVHLDSLFMSLEQLDRGGRPKGRDPTYTRVMDRFLSLADARGAKLTIFVVGRELRDRGVFERVREWARRGHEIANHSYSHRHDLGRLAPKELQDEVLRAHELIAECTGQEPQGFASPFWSASPRLWDVLARAGYRYDASLFPSYLLPLMAARICWTARGPERFRVLRLGTYGGERPLPPAAGDGDLVELPLPTTRRLRLPCYHTMPLVVGWRLFSGILESCLASCDYFYYLMHPLDLLDPAADFPEAGGGLARVARASLPIARKRGCAEQALDIISRERRWITLGEMALEKARAARRPAPFRG